MAGKILYQGGDVIGKKKTTTPVATSNNTAKPPAGTYELGGETKQGYIKNGVTYADANYTTPVPVGSKVYTNGGVFIKSGGGGLKVAKPAVTVPTSNSKAIPVTYTVDGKSNTGYIKDGRTYTDEGLTTRVPYGAVVHTHDGRSYQMTANDGVPTAQTVLNDFDTATGKYMEIYKAAEKAREKQIQASVQAAINRLNAQKAEAEQQKKEADRVAYNAYLRAVNPYGIKAQQMAKLGLGGSGFSETNLASLGNEYQAQVMQAILARDKALRDINLQIEDARLNGDIQRAEALSAYAQNVANMGLSTEQARASLAQSVANNAYNQERDRISDERYDDELAYSRRQNLFNSYLTLINAGLFPEDAAKVLGINPVQLNALKSYYASKMK